MAKQPHPYERSALSKGGVIKRYRQSSKKPTRQPKPDKNAIAALRLLSFRHAEILRRPELYIPDEESTTSSTTTSPSTSPTPSSWQVPAEDIAVDPAPSTSPLCAPVMPPLRSFRNKKARPAPSPRAVSNGSGESAASASFASQRKTPVLRPLRGPLPQMKPLPLAPALAPHLSRMTRPIKIIFDDQQHNRL